MVRTCDQIEWPLQTDRTRHSAREMKKRKAKEKMGRQHQRVDRSRLQQQSESSRRPSELAGDCRQCQQWCPYDPDGSGTQVTGKVKQANQLRRLVLLAMKGYVNDNRIMSLIWRSGSRDRRRDMVYFVLEKSCSQQ